MNALQWEMIMNVNIRCGVNGIHSSDNDDDDDDDAGNLVQVGQFARWWNESVVLVHHQSQHNIHGGTCVCAHTTHSKRVP